MPVFVVRVEMHGASETEYNILHLDMERLGFLRHIRGDDGCIYRLPTATYIGAARGVVGNVKDRVQAAALRLHQNPWVIVCEASDAAWTLPLAPES